MTAAALPAAEQGVMQRPLVSVVIPAYNAEAYLGDCLRSVRAQTGAFELEIIVIDDASTDGTADLASAQERVLLCRQPVNRGPSSARNDGIGIARGDFVAFIDADDLWPPGKLAAQLAVLQRQPDAALVFGDCRQFDETGPRARTQFEAGRLGASVWGAGEIVPDAYLRLLDDNFITTGSVVARRLALTQAGGFAADLRLVEDLDLWLRIARRHQITWCSKVCLLRRRHDANLSRDPEAMSLAFLEVLRRQVADDRGAPPARALRLAAVAAREQLHLADLALQQGQPAAGSRWALRSLKAQPGPRALWRLVRATLMRMTSWLTRQARSRGGVGR